MPTHYEILGLTNKATPEEIKSAYSALTALDKSEQKHDFTIIETAYQTLIDNNKRTAYVQQLLHEAKLENKAPDRTNYLLKLNRYFKEEYPTATTQQILAMSSNKKY